MMSEYFDGEMYECGRYDNAYFYVQAETFVDGDKTFEFLENVVHCEQKELTDEQCVCLLVLYRLYEYKVKIEKMMRIYLSPDNRFKDLDNVTICYVKSLLDKSNFDVFSRCESLDDYMNVLSTPH